MIGFPCSPRPSELLWTEDLKPQAKAMKKECDDTIRAIWLGQSHRPIDFLYQQAKDLRGQEDRAGCAVTLTYLADIACINGKLGPALKYSEEAEQIFASIIEDIKQVHNHAVALYSLGLISQLLGLEQEALEYYENSFGTFETAKNHWSTLPTEKSFPTHCSICFDRITPRIKELRDYVMRARRFEATTGIRCSMLFGCWPVDSSQSEVDKLNVDVKIESISVRMEFRHGGDTYRLERLEAEGAPEPMIQPGREYFIWKPPEGSDQAGWLQGAGYALVWKGMCTSHLDASAEISNDPTLSGRITIDANGNLRTEAKYEEEPLRWPVFVGDPNQDSTTSGIIVGVFRKVNA